MNDLFFALVDAARPDLFVEAGAFEAETSLHIARTHSDCSVIAFEANPDNHAHFARLREFDRNGVQYLNFALTDAPGPVTFHRQTVNGSTIVGHSSLLERSANHDGPVQPVTVQGVRLDDHTPDAARVAMWVDVEGASGQVLRGAARRLAACDVLKIEVEEEPFWEGQSLATDVISQLGDSGLIPVARDIEQPSQYNIVFASTRLLRQRPAIEAIELFIARAQDHASWPVVEAVRAHPFYGRASFAIRKRMGDI
ncbi:FkbM family methyltransferase [Nocardioides baculatus]|uniref:FkbM family methyltransferase n=1 Tax=Nocardioides baculatus TaxID=2801337 RepID=A0ABS1LC61_9ACTN|nr:FkbM family methyltransferase [Nocardioides baculatus]MBL0749127.1 FkbM family methyltransferase [Nocardioides baculatus]